MESRILITGAAGFIGFNLAKNLYNKKFKLVLLDNLSRGKMDKNFKNFCKLKDVKFNRIDLTKTFKLKDNFQYIFHLASTVGVKNVTKNPIHTFQNNISSTINLIKAIKNTSKTNFIFFSTSEVYAPYVFVQKKFLPHKEDLNLFFPEKIKPRDSYLMSKLINEKIVMLSKCKYLILRPHNIYGPRMGFSHVIPELISKIKTKKECKIFSPNHARAFCFIDDAIQQILQLAFKKKNYNEIYNIGNMKEEIKINDLAKKIKFFLNSKCELKRGQITMGSPPRRIPYMKKTLNQIKLISFTNLNKGLRKTIDWYSKNEK